MGKQSAGSAIKSGPAGKYKPVPAQRQTAGPATDRVKRGKNERRFIGGTGKEARQTSPLPELKTKRRQKTKGDEKQEGRSAKKTDGAPREYRKRKTLKRNRKREKRRLKIQGKGYGSEEIPPICLQTRFISRIWMLSASGIL